MNQRYRENMYKAVLNEAIPNIGYNYRTIKDIAKKVGSTTIFVLKVLSNEKLLSLEDYQRILKF